MSENESSRFKGVVEYLIEGDPQGPIQVAIAPYAALYLLDRKAKKFPAWLDLIRRSKAEKKPISFTCDHDMTLLSIEWAAP